MASNETPIVWSSPTTNPQILPLKKGGFIYVAALKKMMEASWLASLQMI